MKFVCDQMLARLGRWLRAAGYDTVIIEKSMQDMEIFKLAVKEDRILITRDKQILDFDPERKHVLWLQSNGTQECAFEMSRQLDINWLLNPFSRCLECNSPLIETNNPDFTQVPKDIQKQSPRFWLCSGCGKVYWEGSHTKRMRNQLQQWQQLQ